MHLGRLFLLAPFLIAASLLPAIHSAAAPADALFRFGLKAYQAGEYDQAAGAFAQSAALRPAGGTLQNLGNVHWQRAQTAAAILSWEQALWLDPFNKSARANLRFARRSAQLETPDLTWYEAVSSWLPANWWAWVAGLSLWLAIGASTLPTLLRRPKLAVYQVIAAFGLAIFLLSVPAHFVVTTRARLGLIVAKETPLRLTPTSEAQFIAYLPAGEPARLQRRRGEYLLVRASHATGWVLSSQFSLIASASSSKPSSSPGK